MSMKPRSRNLHLWTWGWCRSGGPQYTAPPEIHPGSLAHPDRAAHNEPRWGSSPISVQPTNSHVTPTFPPLTLLHSSNPSLHFILLFLCTELILCIRKCHPLASHSFLPYSPAVYVYKVCHLGFEMTTWTNWHLKCQFHWWRSWIGPKHLELFSNYRLVWFPIYQHART